MIFKRNAFFLIIALALLSHPLCSSQAIFEETEPLTNSTTTLYSAQDFSQESVVTADADENFSIHHATPLTDMRGLTESHLDEFKSSAAVIKTSTEKDDYHDYQHRFGKASTTTDYEANFKFDDELKGVHCVRALVNKSRIARIIYEIDQMKSADYPLLSALYASLMLNKRQKEKHLKKRNCFKLLLHRLFDEMSKLKSRTKIPKETFLYDHNFEQLYYMVTLIHNTILFRDKITRDIASQRCATHNPNEILEELANRTLAIPQFFSELVKTSKYNETLFNENCVALLFQSGLSAILAMHCEKLENRSASSPQNHRIWRQYIKRKIEANLHIIFDEARKAKKFLRTTYQEAAANDIQQSLEFASANSSLSQNISGYIFEQLSAKYPYRAWAIVLYRQIHLQDTSVHYHTGTTDNWHHIQGNNYTLIAHSANRETNCTHFGRIIAKKSLRQIFDNDDEYESFFDKNDHLGFSVDRLKKLLIPMLLPQNYFFSAVLHRPDLVALYDDEYHFFEHLRNPKTNRLEKTILIGWC